MEKLTESQYNILQVLKKLIAERGFLLLLGELERLLICHRLRLRIFI